MDELIPLVIITALIGTFTLVVTLVLAGYAITRNLSHRKRLAELERKTHF